MQRILASPLGPRLRELGLALEPGDVSGALSAALGSQLERLRCETRAVELELEVRSRALRLLVAQPHAAQRSALDVPAGLARIEVICAPGVTREGNVFRSAYFTGDFGWLLSRLRASGAPVVFPAA